MLLIPKGQRFLHCPTWMQLQGVHGSYKELLSLCVSNKFFQILFAISWQCSHQALIMEKLWGRNCECAESRDCCTKSLMGKVQLEITLLQRINILNLLIVTTKKCWSRQGNFPGSLKLWDSAEWTAKWNPILLLPISGVGVWQHVSLTLSMAFSNVIQPHCLAHRQLSLRGEWSDTLKTRSQKSMV